MTDNTTIPSDEEVKRVLEEEMPGLTILSMDRQTRWRPQWFMDVEWKGERTKLVLRGDRIQEKEQPLPDEMRFQQLLHERGIPVPAVYHWSDRLYAYVMEFIPGRHPLIGETAEDRDQVVRDYIEALAKLHKLDPQPFLDAGVRTMTNTPVQIEEYRKHKTRPYPFMEFGIGWMERHPWRNPDARSPIVSDSGQFHHENGRMKSIIDLEFGGLGDPLEDLVVWRMRDTLIDFGDFRKIYAYYEELTGDKVDVERAKRAHIMGCFGNELMFGNAVRDPMPETDVMTYMQWDSETSLMATEALAEYYEMDLPTVDIPEPRDLQTEATWAHLTGLLGRLRPDEAYLGEEIRRGFRAVRHLHRVAEIGDQLWADNIEDIHKITGTLYPDWRSAEAGLEEFVLADAAEGRFDRELVWLFHRLQLRTHMMMGPLGSKMIKHYVCQRFDGGERVNTADFDAQAAAAKGAAA
ncbi:MAG: phosphotransferase [Sphingobium sp.]